MENLVEKKIAGTDASMSWLDLVRRYYDTNSSEFKVNLNSLDGSSKSLDDWDKLIELSIKKQFGTDNTAGNKKQYLLFIQNALDGDKATVFKNKKIGKDQIAFTKDAIVNGYLKVKNTELDFKTGFKRFIQTIGNKIQKENFNIGSKEDATSFFEDDLKVVLNYLNKSIQVHKIEFRSVDDLKGLWFIPVVDTQLVDDSGVGNFNAGTVKAQLVPQTLQQQDVKFHGSVSPTNIIELYIYKVLAKQNMTEGTTVEDIESGVLAYFDNNKAIRDKILSRVSAEKGFTSNSILLLYALLKQTYWEYYESRPVELLTTINTLSLYQLGNSSFKLNRITNTGNLESVFFGLGIFNSDYEKTDHGDTKDKVAIFNSLIKYNDVKFTPAIQELDKEQLLKFKLNLFCTSTQGQQTLDDIVERLASPDTKLEASEVARLTSGLPEISLQTIENGLVQTNSTKELKRYLNVFRSSDTREDDVANLTLSYTDINGDQLIKAFKRKEESVLGDIYVIEAPLEFKKGTSIQISSYDKKKDLSTNYIKTYLNTGSDSAIHAGTDVVFKGEGSKFVFTDNYKCDGIQITVRTDERGVQEIVNEKTAIKFLPRLTKIDDVEDEEEKEEKPEENNKPAEVKNSLKKGFGTKQLDSPETIEKIREERDKFINNFRSAVNKEEKEQAVDKLYDFLKEFSADQVDIIRSLWTGGNYRMFNGAIEKLLHPKTELVNNSK